MFDNFHRSITVDITIDVNQQNMLIVSIVQYCICVILIAGIYYKENCLKPNSDLGTLQMLVEPHQVQTFRSL